jgi:hypothetical protein
MAEKKVIIDIVGDETVIDAGLDSFAKSFGYVDGQESPTQLEVVQNALRSYFRNTINAYNIQEGQRLAGEAVLEQSNAALDTTALSVRVE